MDYQDMLAEVGASAAHPGGATLTRWWQQSIPWRPSMDVLDVGCGTGKTLTELCATMGCTGLGVDVRPKMIEKASQRARMRGLANLHFKVASATDLPFEDACFDVVYSESVNVFLDAPETAVKEYCRVLSDSGFYVDIEMLALLPVDGGWRSGVREVYGAQFVPDLKGWRHLYQKAGFKDVRVLMTRSVNPYEMAKTSTEEASDMDLASPGAFTNPRVIEALRKNQEWMERHYRPLGFGVFLCTK